MPYARRGAESHWAWVAFAALLVLYVFSAWRVNPIATFGTMRDDALYFSSAKALASGQGYILPSFPIRLQGTKYPELYPLILAGIWKIDPHFPNNVNLAVGLTLAFGCAALLFAFLLLRRWPGMGDWPALAVVGLCAFTGYFLELSASVMTDVPFMAVMLGAIWMAERSTRRENKCAYWAFGSGLLGGLAVGFRSLGVAVVAGIWLVLLGRHRYRRLLWFSIAMSPLALLFLWPALAAFLHASGARLTVGLGDSGWTQTLCYYSSYTCSWQMGVTSPEALKGVVLTNLESVIQEPGLYLLFPLVSSHSLLSLIAVVLVSFASYAGITRYAYEAGWQPFATAFILYVLVVVPWPYTPDRFLMPFLPLFFVGLWLEGRHFAALVSKNIRATSPPAHRITAGLLAAGALALAAAAATNYVREIPSEITSSAKRNQRLLQDKRGAYAWMRWHAAPNASLIAYEDGLAYLYTGRPTLVPIQATPQSFYLHDPRYATHDAAQLTNVACHIRAAYWLASKEDFRLDGDIDYAALQKRQSQLLATVPLVFQSADGAVRLYDVRHLTQVGCATNNQGQ